MLPTCTGRGAACSSVVIECGSLLLPLPRLQATAIIVSAYDSWRQGCPADQSKAPLMSLWQAVQGSKSLAKQAPLSGRQSQSVPL